MPHVHNIIPIDYNGIILLYFVYYACIVIQQTVQLECNRILRTELCIIHRYYNILCKMFQCTFGKGLRVLKF